jgi:NADH dehydrogenase [ubiquinone] 1 alpha subcomplex assembly factor 7
MKSWIFDHIKDGVSLSEYIEICLYDKENGYYERGNIFGKSGDFVTSPMITSIFSDIILLFFVNIWQEYYKNNQRVNIIEYGAGNGQDMLNKIKMAQRIGIESKVDFYIMERSKKRITEQGTLLKNYNVSWIDKIEDINSDNPYFVYGNEIFDAFGIDQYYHKNGIYKKLFVKYENGVKTYFNDVDSDDISYIKNYIGEIEDESIVEISKSCIEFVDNLSRFMSKKDGCMLFFDYGYRQNPFKSTLQALHKHKKVSPFEMSGLCDITHLVNFELYRKIIAQNMKKCDIFVEMQSDFLSSIGIKQLAEKYINANKSKESEIISALNRILNDMESFYTIISMENLKIS